MEHLRFCPTENTVVGYNYWSYVIDDVEQVETVTFHRVNGDATEDWGAATLAIDLSERGENNLYDISASPVAWKSDGEYATGAWGVYDPEDVGNPDAEEPETERSGAYLVGEGSFVDGEAWSEQADLELSINPSNELEYMILDVELSPRDKLKIKNGDTYCGYAGIEAGCPLKGVELLSDEDDNIVVDAAGSYDFYYKTQSNTLWIAFKEQA